MSNKSEVKSGPSRTAVVKKKKMKTKKLQEILNLKFHKIGFITAFPLLFMATPLGQTQQ